MDFPNLIIQELYTDQLSYTPGETVKIYCSSRISSPFNLFAKLTNISGKRKTSINLPIISQKAASKNILQDGFGYKKSTKFIIPKNYKSGIYLILNNFPLIIKSRKKTAITVVYPFMNNTLYQKHNGKTVFSEQIKYAHLNRPTPLDEYTIGLASFFNSLDSVLPVNYITDLDLEQENNLKNSKLLILYGKLTSWTPKMKKTIKSYLSKGGNVLLMSSYTLNNICWYNKEDNTIILYNDSSSSIKSWSGYNKSLPEQAIGTSYKNGGMSDNSFYKISNKAHPLFKQINTDSISLTTHLSSSPPTKWINNKLEINLDTLNFYSGEILAYEKATYHKNQNGIKGIFVLKPTENSGTIISLGSEDWCLRKNIGEQKQLQIITKNAVNFLLQQ